jgi:hypothetical protein
MAGYVGLVAVFIIYCGFLVSELLNASRANVALGVLVLVDILFRPLFWVLSLAGFFVTLLITSRLLTHRDPK